MWKIYALWYIKYSVFPIPRGHKDKEKSLYNERKTKIKIKLCKEKNKMAKLQANMAGKTTNTHILKK